MSRLTEKRLLWDRAVALVRAYDARMEAETALHSEPALAPRGLPRAELSTFTPNELANLHALGYLNVDPGSGLMRPTTKAYEAELIDAQIDGLRAVLDAIGRPYRKRIDLVSNPSAGSQGIVHVAADLTRLVEHGLFRRDSDGYRVTNTGRAILHTTLDRYVDDLPASERADLASTSRSLSSR